MSKYHPLILVFFLFNISFSLLPNQISADDNFLKEDSSEIDESEDIFLSFDEIVTRKG
jgi:hypothetical protein